MQRSEEAAYRDYVTLRMDILRRTAYLLCHDWHTADDLVSTTLAKLYDKWRRARATPAR
ncbi:sigma factor [Dactylosporangium sp. NPDC051484]|uniref:sigma factor n=1 Tax=Dactylosporangium sp. NPDC051484 TaxID=3154942 RepID=UPI00344DC17F